MLAGWSAIVKATSEEAAAAMAAAAVLLGAVGDRSLETTTKRADVVNTLEDVGRAFCRVIKAGREATRRFDSKEMWEKGEDLLIRANKARAGSEGAPRALWASGWRGCVPHLPVVVSQVWIGQRDVVPWWPCSGRW
jgi:hypothetical protein